MIQLEYIVSIIDLVTVFDAILTSRQAREKLRWLYENLMSDNFLRTAVLKKNMIVDYKWPFFLIPYFELICNEVLNPKKFCTFLPLKLWHFPEKSDRYVLSVKMETTFLAGIFISLTEETVKYRRQVKIVQTVQRETVAT